MENRTASGQVICGCVDFNVNTSPRRVYWLSSYSHHGFPPYPVAARRKSALIREDGTHRLEALCPSIRVDRDVLRVVSAVRSSAPLLYADAIQNLTRFASESASIHCIPRPRHQQRSQNTLTPACLRNRRNMARTRRNSLCSRGFISSWWRAFSCNLDSMPGHGAPPVTFWQKLDMGRSTRYVPQMKYPATPLTSFVRLCNPSSLCF